MEKDSVKKLFVVFGFGLVGWILWGVFIGIIIGLKSGNTIGEGVELLLHAILPPIAFLIVSPIYFRKFRYTTPLQTAVAFPAIILVLDVLIVALIVEGSFAIFASPAPWASYALAFVFTLLIGRYMGTVSGSETERVPSPLGREWRLDKTN